MRSSARSSERMQDEAADEEREDEDQGVTFTAVRNGSRRWLWPSPEVRE